MNSKDQIKNGKHLALILRHKPELADVQLGHGGYAEIKSILSYLDITHDELRQLVETDDKTRFSFDKSGSKIRANQGHSIPVEIEFQEFDELDYLWHGTSSKFLEAIKDSGGLKPQSRTHVHLSKDMATAIQVGKRHTRGRASVVLLGIDAKTMRDDGLKLSVSENGVVLTKSVDWKYIEVLGYDY